MDSDKIACPLCMHIIKTNGKLENGDTTPYTGRSLITHFKRDHGTNSLGIDKILGLVPGTTQNCSDSLRKSFSNTAKSEEKDTQKSSRREVEDEIIADGMFS